MRFACLFAIAPFIFPHPHPDTFLFRRNFSFDFPLFSSFSEIKNETFKRFSLSLVEILSFVSCFVVRFFAKLAIKIIKIQGGGGGGRSETKKSRPKSKYKRSRCLTENVRRENRESRGIPKRRQKKSERKEVHQIFQRRGILISGKAESSGIPGCEDEICTSHQCRYDFHFTVCFFPFQPLLHLFSPSPLSAFFSPPSKRRETDLASLLSRPAPSTIASTKRV